MARRLRGALAALVSLAALTGTGCGGDGDTGAARGAPEAQPGAGGALLYALAAEPREVDPLNANSRAAQLVTRQVHEPLVQSLSGPFGDAPRLDGPAQRWRSSADREIWSFVLRRGVRFQDGTPLNATAVLANVERWLTLRPGRELLPELSAADAPRPDLVRFVLTRPVKDLPARLASPRLGLVSPAALRPRSGEDARLARTDRTGSGPFELREEEVDRAVIARNVSWWGTRLDLGPALDQVEFRVVPVERTRLALLRRGDVQVADSLGPDAIPTLRDSPLLTFLRGDRGAVLGLERSVRGIDSARAIGPLSDVWLTTVGAG